jgi:tetratricopeptide (TPR) repeat protein
MKQIRFYQIITAVCCLLLISCGIDKNLKKGEKFLALGEYYDAADQFKQAYTKTPSKERASRGKIALKMARCYDKINSTPKAIAAYRNAVRYNQASIDDRLAYARLLLKNGEYKQAEKEFRILVDSLPDNVLARNGLKSAQLAPTWKREGGRYKVKKMDVFNSRRDDYSPMLLGDEADQLYFTSTRNEAQGDELSGITGTKAGDIFLSEKDDKGKWRKPSPRASTPPTTRVPAASLPMAGRCISRNASPMHLLPDSPKSSPPAARMRHGESRIRWNSPRIP